MSDSDSDSDSGCEWRAAELDKNHEFAFLNKAKDITIFNPKAPLLSPEDVFENWDEITDHEKMISGQYMKMCAFWCPILLQRVEGSTVVCWAAQVGLVEPYEDLSLKHIQKIEILEAILRALVKGTLKKTPTKQVMSITNRFYMHSPEVLENAIQWLEGTGEANIRQRVLEFGHLDTCFKALHLIFVEFAQYVKAMSLSYQATMAALTAPRADPIIRKCEELKKKGNEQFQLQLYEDAVNYYSKALKYCPDNHIIFSNRALSYLKAHKYLKALGDSKKATLIKPDWFKGHYRYCEALFGLGEVHLALEANSWGQSLCKDDAGGLRELESQKIKISNGTTGFVRTVSRARSQSEAKEAAAPASPKAKDKNSVKTEPKLEKRSQSANNRMNKSSAATAKTEPSQTKPQTKPQTKAAKGTPQKTPQKSVPEEVSARQKEQSERSADVSKELLAAVTDAHAALAHQRSRNAEQAFSRALSLIHNAKAVGVSSVDVLLLQFGRVSALTEIGRPQELSEAVRVLDTLQASDERTFQCLVFLAYGRVYVKENRFSLALTNFLDSLKIVKNQITPGILTWPLTPHVVPETRVDYLMDVLQVSIELCRFPPPPDAVCRTEKCISAVKKQIYFTDPDFKGFIRVCCCHSCSVEYHINCWKSLKTLCFLEKSEKDFLQDPCLTPDCKGQINSIRIYGPTGLVKCKFEVAIPKPVAVKRPKVKQTCTSLKKIKSKEERRLRRYKYIIQENGEINEDKQKETITGGEQAPPTAWLHFRDHMLLQISQHMDLLRGERSWSGSSLRSSLTPWLLLDLSKGGTVAPRLLQTLEEADVSLGAAAELLLERRNRVWARLLIQDLSRSEGLQPKLLSWATRLDAAGLAAAQMFLQQFSSELEVLDLSLLWSFGPVQSLVAEKLGSAVLTELGLTATDFLSQCPPEEVRLFIWALEEHRQHYSSCHGLLDQYFDMMDGLCSVIKKSEDNNCSSPNKSKHRSRKKKGPKQLLVWAEPQGSPGADDWDPGLIDDDSLSFLELPFSVPPHLRQQVAAFEQHFNRTRADCGPDHAPDPSTAALYEYFSQILLEHGPLPPDDPLLVSELRNFPATAQQQIEAAGGLRAFLLRGGAFVEAGGCVGVAGALTPPGPAPFDSLDQLDTIEGGVSPTLNPTHFFNIIKDTFPALHHRYDLYGDPGHAHSDSDHAHAGHAHSDHAHSEAAGASGDRVELLSVAVNTEEIQELERYQGELLVQMKTHQKMRRQMVSRTTVETYKRELQRNKELQELQDELNLASSSVQVTQKELSLFQHKLEEEVKKDQKEKKEHQEQLKGLRQELEALHQEKNRVKRSITEKNSEYDNRLRDFLELSNQSAAERMSLEEELKRCNDIVTRASRRSLSAQVRVLEWTRGQSLFSLHRELADHRAVLHRLGDVAPRFSHNDLDVAQDEVRSTIQDIEKKISSTKTHYEQLMKDLNGAEVNDQRREVKEVTRQATPPQTVTSETLAVQATPPTPPPPAAKKKRQKKPTEIPPVFERAMERLSAIFPHVSRAEFSSLIQRLRISSGRSLHSLTLQDLVGGVTQMIVDQQKEQERAQASANGASAWQPVEQQRSAHLDALNMDDPCIICHEDMSPENMSVLECRHGFHTECIRSWLKEQSTCPTCRDHTLLPEDFPRLSAPGGRRH